MTAPTFRDRTSDIAPFHKSGFPELVNRRQKGSCLNVDPLFFGHLWTHRSFEKQLNYRCFGHFLKVNTLKNMENDCKNSSLSSQKSQSWMWPRSIWSTFPRGISCQQLQHSASLSNTRIADSDHFPSQLKLEHHDTTSCCPPERERVGSFRVATAELQRQYWLTVLLQYLVPVPRDPQEAEGKNT